MKTRIKIQGLLILLATAATALLHKLIFSHWNKGPLDEFLDSAGIFLVLFGFLFRISSRGHKEEKSSNGTVLVKDGPYFLVRNPMYFGTFLIGTGISLVLMSWWAVPGFLFIFLCLYLPQSKKEENVLSKRFGKEYENYCKETPRFFPNLHCLLNFNKYIHLRLSWVKSEMFSFAATASSVIFIEIWEDIKLFGQEKFLRELMKLGFIIMVFIFIAALLIRRTKGKRSGLKF